LITGSGKGIGEATTSLGARAIMIVHGVTLRAALTIPRAY
jgi:NAD(P)-dependent dehydrogenase (short-subunit alcohol dehydrogenase family)